MAGVWQAWQEQIKTEQCFFDELNWRTFGVKSRSYIVAGVDQDVVSLWQAWQELIKTLSRQSDVLLHAFKWRTFGVKSSSYIVAGVDQDVVSLFHGVADS